MYDSQEMIQLQIYMEDKSKLLSTVQIAQKKADYKDEQHLLVEVSYVL